MNRDWKADWLLLAAYIYILLPVALFLLLWLKLWIGIPVTMLLIVGAVLTFRKDKLSWKPEKKQLTIAVLIAGLLIIVLWVLTSGIGASVTQYPDHDYRNALFKALVDNPWPVKISDLSGQPRGMSYYIGFWLPAALVGKLFSYSAGFLFQQLWAVLGIFLCWYFVCEKMQKMRLWTLVVFIFFGGLDWPGTLLTGDIFEPVGNRMEWWASVFIYPGMTTGLFWAFNQVIYGWILYCLIMRQENNRGLFLIWSAALISCTFPAAGMIPFVVYRAIRNTSSEEKPLRRCVQALRGTFCTLPGISGIFVFLISFLYTVSNSSVRVSMDLMSGTKTVWAGTAESAGTAAAAAPGKGSFQAYPFTTQLWIFLLFALLEFGIFYFLIYRSQGKNPLYWISLGVLLICPWIQVGTWIDFMLRANIPALFCLYELVISALIDFRKKKQYVLQGLLIGTLCLASVTCFDTFLGVMNPMAENLWYKEEVIPIVKEEKVLGDGLNFTAPEESFFFTYLAR